MENYVQESRVASGFRGGVAGMDRFPFLLHHPGIQRRHISLPNTYSTVSSVTVPCFSSVHAAFIGAMSVPVDGVVMVLLCVGLTLWPVVSSLPCT